MVLLLSSAIFLQKHFSEFLL